MEQGATILKNRKIECLFTTPKLLEALGEKINVPDAGIKGVFCGGTQMTPQMVERSRTYAQHMQELQQIRAQPDWSTFFNTRFSDELARTA